LGQISGPILLFVALLFLRFCLLFFPPQCISGTLKKLFLFHSSPFPSGVLAGPLHFGFVWLYVACMEEQPRTRSFPKFDLVRSGRSWNTFAPLVLYSSLAPVHMCSITLSNSSRVPPPSIPPHPRLGDAPECLFCHPTLVAVLHRKSLSVTLLFFFAELYPRYFCSHRNSFPPFGFERRRWECWAVFSALARIFFPLFYIACDEH